MVTVTGFLSVGENTTSEVEEVQKICALYEDILRLVQRRISGLERDVKSFKSHTDSLKGELSAACQRLAMDDLPLAKPLREREREREREGERGREREREIIQKEKERESEREREREREREMVFLPSSSC
eukprot:sb/3475241/